MSETVLFLLQFVEKVIFYFAVLCFVFLPSLPANNTSFPNVLLVIYIMFGLNYVCCNRGQKSSSYQNFVQPESESVRRPSSRRAMSRQNTELAATNT